MLWCLKYPWSNKMFPQLKLQGVGLVDKSWHLGVCLLPAGSWVQNLCYQLVSGLSIRSFTLAFIKLPTSHGVIGNPRINQGARKRPIIAYSRSTIWHCNVVTPQTKDRHHTNLVTPCLPITQQKWITMSLSPNLSLYKWLGYHKNNHKCWIISWPKHLKFSKIK